MAIIHRIKVLLSVAQEVGGVISDARLQHLLFLYCIEEVKRDEYYEFIPSAGSPHSLQAANDKGYLIHKKLIEDAPHWAAIAGKPRYAVDLDFFEKIAIQTLKTKWAGQPDKAIAAHIASHYPDMAALPVLIENAEPRFFTIGYEGASPEAYINCLLRADICLLVDVRKNSLSKKFGFSKHELREGLARVGIDYLHIPELGIVSEKRQELNSDADYAALFREYEATTLRQQTAKLDQLQRLLAERGRIAITCFEASHHHCHRGCIADAMRSRDGFTTKIEHLNPCSHRASQNQNARKSS
jgi:hypothetical protein